MKSEKQKMIEGELYHPNDSELSNDRIRAQKLCKDLELALNEEHPQIIAQLLSSSESVTITPPFRCDYGYNIRLGKGVYLNFNCIFLDTCKIIIGDRTLLGPAVHIYTATHPISSVERGTGLEYGCPVVVGNDVWIGGGAILCPGVSIGDRSVIGAGSVVTRDIPSDVVAAGNPCRVIRSVSNKN